MFELRLSSRPPASWPAVDAATSYWAMGGFMMVLGSGIGLVMQVPMIVVQSTTDYADLGVATSGISFLRTMGSPAAVHALPPRSPVR